MKKIKLEYLKNKNVFILVLLFCSVVYYGLTSFYEIDPQSSLYELILQVDGNNLFISFFILFSIVILRSLNTFSSLSAIFVPSFLRYNFIMASKGYSNITSLFGKLKPNKKENNEPDTENIFIHLSAVASLVLGVIGIIFGLIHNVSEIYTDKSECKLWQRIDISTFFLIALLIYLLASILSSIVSGKLFNDPVEQYIFQNKNNLNSSDFPSLSSRVTLFRLYIICISIILTWYKFWLEVNEKSDLENISINIERTSFIFTIIIFIVVYILNYKHNRLYSAEAKVVKVNENKDKVSSLNDSEKNSNSI